MTKFKDVAHLYLGCKIKTEEGIGTLDEISTEKSDDVTITSYDLVNAYLKFDEFKPILRPLLDMTDDERIECDKQGSIGWHIIANGAPISMNENFDKIGLAVVHRQSSEVTYLLSRGFDLFGLIENGEAITLTNTHIIS